MPRAYDTYLSQSDKAVLEVYGRENAAGFGTRPALLVVDATYAFVGEAREAPWEAARKRRNACGEPAWRALDALIGVIESARANKVPVIYTKGADRPDLISLGAKSLKKSPRSSVTTSNLRNGNEIVDQIRPGPGDIVIAKEKPSAFFATPLLSYLVALGVDSLFITGGATSGCVRASVVDAFSNNFPCWLLQDCCFDRFEASHDMTLFDIGAKYAEIRSAADAIRNIEAVSARIVQHDRPILQD